MIKVAVFENELNPIKRSFDATNLIYFKKELDFKYFESSQKFGDLTELNSYQVVLLDIDLSLKSKMDGYQILLDLKQKNVRTNNIIIITGHDNVKSRLAEIGFNDIPIIQKTIDIKLLSDEIKKIISAHAA